MAKALFFAAVLNGNRPEIGNLLRRTLERVGPGHFVGSRGPHNLVVKDLIDIRIRGTNYRIFGGQVGNIPRWRPSRYVKKGTYGTVGNRVYVCVQSGFTGPTGPTGTGDGIVNGTSVWDFYSRDTLTLLENQLGNGRLLTGKQAWGSNQVRARLQAAGLKRVRRKAGRAVVGFLPPVAFGGDRRRDSALDDADDPNDFEDDD